MEFNDLFKMAKELPKKEGTVAAINFSGILEVDSETEIPVIGFVDALGNYNIIPAYNPPPKTEPVYINLCEQIAGNLELRSPKPLIGEEPEEVCEKCKFKHWDCEATEIEWGGINEDIIIGCDDFEPRAEE